jgi:hypothetical protein
MAVEGHVLWLRKPSRQEFAYAASPDLGSRLEDVLVDAPLDFQKNRGISRVVIGSDSEFIAVARILHRVPKGVQI